MTIAFNLSQLANYVNSSGKLDAANGLVNATPVANGGTGAASATAYAVQCGGTTSTGAHQSIASVGTAGQILTSNGVSALPSFQAPPSSGFGNMTVFTSNGTWSVPVGVTKCKVTVVGGGGNGGYSTSDDFGLYPGSGGGGGGAAIKIISSGLGSTVSVIVGGAGGTSSFGAFCSASGGSSGLLNGGNGFGGIGSDGDLNIGGSAGGTGQNASVYRGGAGGSSIFGGGGSGALDISQAGYAGRNYGGGGGGTSWYAGTEGAGASGVVIIEY
jgi:hypothetical protein